MTTYVVPIVAMAWGMFDHERISTQQLLAMVGVFVMVALVQSGARNDEELIELLPETTTDNLEPAPLELRHNNSLVTSASLISATSDAAACAPPVTSA